jgi:hypothetical protein
MKPALDAGDARKIALAAASGTLSTCTGDRRYIAGHGVSLTRVSLQ